jgi:hypothetical protein
VSKKNEKRPQKSSVRKKCWFTLKETTQTRPDNDTTQQLSHIHIYRHDTDTTPRRQTTLSFRKCFLIGIALGIFPNECWELNRYPVISLHISTYIYDCLFVVYLTMHFHHWDYIASSKMVISEWWIEKDLEGSGRGLILRYCPWIRLEGLKKTTKPLRQDSRIPNRDLNLGPPEYEAGVLLIRPRRSVLLLYSIIISILLINIHKRKGMRIPVWFRFPPILPRRSPKMFFF